MLDCDIAHFQNHTQGKGMNSLIPSYGLNSNATNFNKDGFGIK